ncbi:MAG: acetamidase/formamidase family protein, partial [Oscillospiraceae bacterium]|nr:acetamidase/formamidase family protein [Oscillospiraceae bacterium]
MKTIRQEGNYSYLFSRYAPVVATVEPGETVEIYTEDAFSGLIKEETDLASKLERTGPNPQTGPIYINGAQPGDSLAVHIQ